MRWKKQADRKKRTKRKYKPHLLQPRWNSSFYKENLEEKIHRLKSISSVCRIVFIWRKKTTMEQRVDWMVMSCEARKSKNFLTFAPLQDVSGPGLQFAAHTVENHMIFWRNASWNLDKYTLQRQQKLFDFCTVTRYVWAWSAGLNPFLQKLKILSYFGQKIHFSVAVQLQPSTYYHKGNFGCLLHLYKICLGLVCRPANRLCHSW